MPSLLSLVGSPQADHTNLLSAQRNDRDVEPALDVAEHSDPTLPVIRARVLDADRRLKIHVSEALETDASLFEVPGALRLVELEHRDYIVYTFK
jgi:hypothetical protein